MKVVRFRRYTPEDDSDYEECEIVVTLRAIKSDDMDRLKSLFESYLDSGKYVRKVRIKEDELD